MKHTLHHINLKGGSKVLLIDVPNSPALYFASIVRAGMRYGTRERFELSHLLEHLAFEGNADFPKGRDFMFEIEKLGAYVNAETSEPLIRYYFESSIDSLDRIVELAASQIRQPVFSEESIKQEKAVVTSELSRYIEDDSDRCWLANIQRLYADGWPTYEEEIASLDNISRQDLISFYSEYHTGGNTRFLMVGSFTGKVTAIKDKLEAELAEYPAGELKPWRGVKLTKKLRQSTSLSTKLASQSHFRLTFHWEDYQHELLPVFRIFNAIYNMGSFSRLFYQSRKRGLTYSTYSGSSLRPDGSEFYIVDQTEPHKSLPLFELCIQELVSILDGDFSKREFERAKGYVTGNFESSFQTPRSFAGWYGSDFSADRELIAPLEYKELLRAVKPADIKKLKQFFTTGRWVLSLVGKEIKQDESKYRDVLEKYLR